MKWFFKCFKQYADFSGRARRKEYWWFTLINFIIMAILIIGMLVPVIKLGYSSAMSGGSMNDVDPMELAMSIFKNPCLYLYLVYYLAILVPTISVFVRRMHDIGRSGYWAFLYFGLSLIGQVVNFSFQSDGAKGITVITSMVILFISIFFLVWLFTNSQYGPNQYGPNPKGEGNPQEDVSTTLQEDVSTTFQTNEQ